MVFPRPLRNQQHLILRTEERRMMKYEYDRCSAEKDVRTVEQFTEKTAIIPYLL